MQAIESPDTHHVSAAIGWLGLGNWMEANEELKKILPNLRNHPDVLEVRFEIYAKAEKWELAAEIAKTVADLKPRQPHLWIALAYATRRKPGGGIPEAKEILAKAHQVFPNNPTIAYNLACYECQLGNLEGARAWLGEAFESREARHFKLLALEDPDLERLRVEIGLS
jgi:predicted Zn-dependent protease